MLWNQIRSAAATAALAATLAAGASGLAVVGAQDPAPPAVQAAQPAPSAAPGPARTPEDAPVIPRLRNQRLATRKARLDANMARLARERAELAVQEYEELTYPRELASVEFDVRQVEAALGDSEQRVQRVHAMQAKGEASPQAQANAEATLGEIRFELGLARTRRDLLTKLTHDKALKALRAEAAKAEADQSASEAVWEMERARESRLGGQLDPK